ncbi:MAG: TonB-dependent receptor plug domain-containing protein, partial [Bacteroidota bacterium]
VNPQDESPYEKYGENIENYLLFSSDLKGKIESPGSYFVGTEKAYEALDLLMLTHGWSRFDWASLLKENDFSAQYLPEEGLKIMGKAVNYYNDKALKEPLVGVTISSLGILDETFNTNKDGAFQIAGLRLMDSTRIFIQAYKEKSGKLKKYESAKIKLEYPSRPEVNYFADAESGVDPDFLEKAEKLNQISETYFLYNETTRLDEVVVSAKSLKQDEIRKRTIYAEPSDRIILDSLGFVGGQSVFELLRQVPGVSVVGTFPNQSVQIRGVTSLSSRPPIYLLDGIPVDDGTIQSISILDVEFIDVLKGPDAAVFGSRGSGGVILVYTKRGQSNYKDDGQEPTGLLAFIHPGYHKAKEFYSPEYDVEKEEHIVPDFRSTLHWHPELKFEDQQATTSFYTSDQAGNFTIRIEGIYTNGKPFFIESSINVE